MRINFDCTIIINNLTFTLVVTPSLDETLMVFEPNKSPISSSIPVSAVKIPTTIKNKTEKSTLIEIRIDLIFSVFVTPKKI